jgi:hypothetical protein
MSMVQSSVAASPDRSVDRVSGFRASSYVEWAPIAGGAAAAAAISFVLLTFGSAIGLSAVSPWPDSGLPWWAIGLIGAVWLLLVQVGSYALGGYIAGRMRAPIGELAIAERQFRDGAHGFLVWAVGVVLTALVVGWTVGAAVKTGTEAAATLAGAAAGGTAAALSSDADPLGYNIDRLLRVSGDPPQAAASAGSENVDDDRAEIARIFGTALDGGELAADDRAYLASVVSERSGLPTPEAEARVDAAYGAIQEARVEAMEAADSARKATAIGAFLTAAALLVAAAAAASGAGLGGRHRDENGALRLFGRDRFW